MSNDLYVLDSPRSVIRTYSNYNRRRTDEQSSPSSARREEGNTDNLRVVAINNNITKQEREDLEMQMFSVSIHNQNRVERWQDGIFLDKIYKNQWPQDFESLASNYWYLSFHSFSYLSIFILYFISHSKYTWKCQITGLLICQKIKLLG